MIIRGPRPEGHFTILRNCLLRDETLSFRARGILACVLSRPDDWRTTSEMLAKQSGGREGRDAIRTALKELNQCGSEEQLKVWTALAATYAMPEEKRALLLSIYQEQKESLTSEPKSEPKRKSVKTPVA